MATSSGEAADVIECGSAWGKRSLVNQPVFLRMRNGLVHETKASLHCITGLRRVFVYYSLPIVLGRSIRS